MMDHITDVQIGPLTEPKYIQCYKLSFKQVMRTAVYKTLSSIIYFISYIMYRMKSRECGNALDNMTGK